MELIVFMIRLGKIVGKKVQHYRHNDDNAVLFFRQRFVENQVAKLTTSF